jgi:uncharacterized LabA/DUF88 family protein
MGREEMAVGSENGDSSEGRATLALLIDGDNVTPSIAVHLLAEVAKYGTASVKRIYGDWTKPHLKGWKDCLLEHSIQPIQQFAYTSGKNSTDGALIIDAMDLLYSGRFDGFCIVSSDSDFARLASRIREQGLTVYGFGERKTARSFIVSCDKFVYFDVLSTSDEEPLANLSGSEKAKAKASKKVRDRGLLKLLRTAVTAVTDETGWANLGPIGNYIAKQSPEFDARNYGYARLGELFEATGTFDIDRSGKSVLIRVRSK